MNAASTVVQGKNIRDQNKSEKKSAPSWKTNKDSSRYFNIASEIQGNRIQPCIAELTIDKKNPDESIY